MEQSEHNMATEIENKNSVVDLVHPRSNEKQLEIALMNILNDFVFNLNYQAVPKAIYRDMAIGQIKIAMKADSLPKNEVAHDLNDLHNLLHQHLYAQNNKQSDLQFYMERNQFYELFFNEFIEKYGIVLDTGVKQ